MPKPIFPRRAAAPAALKRRGPAVARGAYRLHRRVAAPNGEKPPARVTKRDIARAFGVKGEAKAELKLLIKDLQAEGAIARGRKALQVQGRLPALVVADIAERDRDGELIAKPVEWNEEGPPPRILVRRPRSEARQRAGAGLGRARADAGRVRSRTPRAKRPPIPDGWSRSSTSCRRACSRSFAGRRTVRAGRCRSKSAPRRASSSFRPRLPGTPRTATSLRSNRCARRVSAPLRARVVESLGSVKSEKAVSLIALASHHIPYVFSPAALKEAETARPARLAPPREDWRDLPLVTIDPPDAKDHDDAVHAAPDPDPANRRRLCRHRRDRRRRGLRPPRAPPLDREALERGNSVYFPDRVVPMLPERISNDLCSLRAARGPAGAGGAHDPRRRRAQAFAPLSSHHDALGGEARLRAGAGGRSTARPDETTAPLLETVLKPLYAAHAALKIERERRDPLDLDLPERKLVLDKEGRLAGVRWPERLDAHRLIEEFMILANVAAAETLEAQHSPLLYRAHDAPSVEKLNDLSRVPRHASASSSRKGERVRPSHFNGVLEPGEGAGGRGAGQRSRAARAGAGRIQPRELWPFRPESAPLRAFHLADPPLCRSHRPSRADPRARVSATAGSTDLRGGDLAHIAEHISAAERRAMAAERETVGPSRRRPSRATVSAPASRRGSPASRGSACS